MQSPYDPDPNCPHEQLVDTLPPIDFAAHFRATGEIPLRLRQWECVSCGGAFTGKTWGTYAVDAARNTATKLPPRAPLQRGKRRAAA